MYTHEHGKPDSNDPLGLSKLDSIQPDLDGWGEIETALKGHQASKQRWRKTTTWLAVAASLVVVVGISMRGMQSNPPALNNSPQLATTSENTASLSVNDATASDDIDRHRKLPVQRGL